MSRPITDLEWQHIRQLYDRASHVTSRLGRSVPYCALATVDNDGAPRVAPISSLVLGETRQGFYFDHFSSRTSKNLDRDHRVCVLLVSNHQWFWKKAILLGRFDSPPGVRLFGVTGEKRAATDQEIAALRRPIRLLRPFRGYQALWGDMKTVRDIYFERFEKIRCGNILESMSL